MSSMRDESGNVTPYQARHVVFQTDDQLSTSQGAAGVRVASAPTEDVEPRYQYQPHHPLAIKDGKWKGYVAYPNINLTEQFVDALQATRAYEANVGVMEITKGMSQQTLRILA
ncbi:MAG: flagellar basal body rod protein FlgC [Planctomycetes bacterium]|nr:flagellar basal body rod protein FlgC [Planctomycetota bacterium]